MAVDNPVMCRGIAWMTSQEVFSAVRFYYGPDLLSVAK